MAARAFTEFPTAPVTECESAAAFHFVATLWPDDEILALGTLLAPKIILNCEEAFWHGVLYLISGLEDAIFLPMVSLRVTGDAKGFPTFQTSIRMRVLLLYPDKLEATFRVPALDDLLCRSQIFPKHNVKQPIDLPLRSDILDVRNGERLPAPRFGTHETCATQFDVLWDVSREAVLVVVVPAAS